MYSPYIPQEEFVELVKGEGQQLEDFTSITKVSPVFRGWVLGDWLDSCLDLNFSLDACGL